MVPSASKGFGMFKQLPNLPELPNSGYRMKNVAFDPGNDKSWGMLALPAQRIASDLDSQREIIKRMLPAGGEQNLALADATNRSFGQIGELRQGQVSDALGGITQMYNTKAFQVPMQGPSGSAGGLMGNYMTGRGQDMDYGLGLSNLRFNQQQANKFPWMNVFQTIGSLAANAFPK